jgi:hypothetical protein
VDDRLEWTMDLRPPAPQETVPPAWPAREIVPGIWQSGSPEPGEHWDVVVDLDCDLPALPGVGLYVHWPIVDGPLPLDRDLLVALADMVGSLRRADKRILVHCAGGINRSALLCAVILMRAGSTAAEAVDTIRARRPGALDNAEFLRLLEGGF